MTSAGAAARSGPAPRDTDGASRVAPGDRTREAHGKGTCVGHRTPASPPRGGWTPEAAGDYVSGPNHVLPTARSARFSSGLSVLDFLKRTTLSRLNPAALAAIGPAAVLEKPCMLDRPIAVLQKVAADVTAAGAS